MSSGQHFLHANPVIAFTNSNLCISSIFIPAVTSVIGSLSDYGIGLAYSANSPIFLFRSRANLFLVRSKVGRRIKELGKSVPIAWKSHMMLCKLAKETRDPRQTEDGSPHPTIKSYMGDNDRQRVAPYVCIMCRRVVTPGLQGTRIFI